MKRKQRFILLIFVAVMSLVSYYLLSFHQVSPKSFSNETQSSKSITKTFLKETASEVPPKKSCVTSTLEKIAGRCNTNCLYDHIRRRDPELVTILRELKTLTKNPKTRVGKFYSTAFDVHPDIPSKERALRQLVAEDSENAYPAFFLGELISSYNEAEARAILEQGVRRKTYESYFTQYFRRLKIATIDSLEVYARAIIFNRELQIHQMNTSVLWGIKDFDEKLARSVALRILKPTFDLKGEFGDILWNREDYLMTRHMLGAADSTEDSQYPEYEVEEMVMDRHSPGLGKEYHVNAFINERTREMERLRRMKSRGL